jgi:hypothetical protein
MAGYDFIFRIFVIKAEREEALGTRKNQIYSGFGDGNVFIFICMSV